MSDFAKGLSDLTGVIKRILGEERVRCDYANHIGFNTFDCQECALDAKLDHIEEQAEQIVLTEAQKEARSNDELYQNELQRRSGC